MNRAMKKKLTPTRIIIMNLQRACGVHWTYHGELHPTNKIKRIIYGDGKWKNTKQIEVPHADKENPKGWGMNNSPFRERKAGLNWGGGNVHAANAKRNKGRGFLK